MGLLNIHSKLFFTGHHGIGAVKFDVYLHDFGPHNFFTNLISGSRIIIRLHEKWILIGLGYGVQISRFRISRFTLFPFILYFIALKPCG
jgi:hypothetical protein